MTSRSPCRSRLSRSSPLLAAVLLLLSAAAISAQVAPSSGGATFRIFQHGVEIGITSSSVEPEPAGDPVGWVIRGSSFVGGEYKLTVRRFEAHYDPEWRARFATMELSTPGDSLVAHTAINGGNTRTEVVPSGKSAMWGGLKTSPDTIVIPDMVFAAFEALAARLSHAQPGTELPIFVLPLSEIRLRVDSVTSEALPTTAGALPTRHWKVAFQTLTRHAPADIWAADGRLVRVDMVLDGISVIRSDLVR